MLKANTIIITLIIGMDTVIRVILFGCSQVKSYQFKVHIKLSRQHIHIPPSIVISFLDLGFNPLLAGLLRKSMRKKNISLPEKPF